MQLRIEHEFINLRDVPGHLPTAVTVQTVKRWAKHGCNGVVLQTIKVGRKRLTTHKAIEDFCHSLSHPVTDTI